MLELAMCVAICIEPIVFFSDGSVASSEGPVFIVNDWLGIVEFIPV